ncbi:CDP-diacylglycerol--glycerol-3-phosphate 3-phosphatidyltransferase [Candidatus Babeliales bacterium]|nr:CDP-diacylglycerol--glycerol-3-phosphate 3-phosphatidyltransferase [Candidatus Babeliales bacterium]
MRDLIPTVLTLIRMLVSPFLLPFLFVYLAPLNVFWINILLALIFVLLSVTDLLDGYVARRLGAESDIGKILDPIADKVLLYSALIALLAANKIYFVWVLIMVIRELFVTGIRQVASEQGIAIPVSFIGKLKTFFQMIYVTIVILNPNKHMLWYISGWNQLELLALICALTLSLWSASRYYRHFIRDLGIKPPKDEAFLHDEWQEPTA